MNVLATPLRKVAADRTAASATEYALMLGILAAGLVLSFTGLGVRLDTALGLLNF